MSDVLPFRPPLVSLRAHSHTQRSLADICADDVLDAINIKMMSRKNNKKQK